MGLGFCCCCIPALVGVIIIDILYLIGGVGEILTGTLLLKITNLCSNSTFELYEDAQPYVDNATYYCETFVEPYIITIGSVIIGLGSFVLVAAVLHIIGSTKRKTALMWPMLLWQLVILVFCFLLAISIFALTAIFLEGDLAIAGYIAGGVVAVICSIYSYFVKFFFTFKSRVAKKVREAQKFVKQQEAMMSLHAQSQPQMPLFNQGYPPQFQQKGQVYPTQTRQ